MAVGDAHVFPGFLTPVLTQLFFPKTAFSTCFCRGDRWKYGGKKSCLNQGSNSQPPGHESDTLTTEPPGRGSHKMNSTFFVTIVPTCDLLGGASFDPRGNIWIKLIKAHKEMLYTKYESPTPSIFREEEFWSFPSLFLCSNWWPPMIGPVLTPGASYVQTMLRFTKRCCILNIKTLHLPVSEKMNFEDELLCSYVPTWDPRDGASFDSRGIIWTNLVEVHQKMLHTKYQSSSPYRLGQEDF